MPLLFFGFSGIVCFQNNAAVFPNKCDENNLLDKKEQAPTLS